jgi:hypothetical protein
MHGGPKGWLGLGLAARSGGDAARSAVTTRISHARRHGGMLGGGPVAAGRQQGAAGELMGATGRASGQAIGGGTHSSGGAMERRWRMLRAAAFISGEGAPVAGDDGGTTLWCWCRRGKVRAASTGDNGGGWGVSP